MIWGTFTKTHIATLILGVIINVVAFLILRKKSRTNQILTLFFISFIGLAGVAYNMLPLSDMSTIVTRLPLSFWSLGAIILPFAVLTRSNWSCNLMLLWSLESLLALVLNYDMAGVPILSLNFLMYYFPHLVIFSVTILLFELGLIDRDFKYIKTSIFITFLTYTAVHFVNTAINSGFMNPTGATVNYMFSLYPETNKIFNFFHVVIPSPYWYMILTLPFILFYLLWWYLPEILDDVKRKRMLRKKLRLIDYYYDEYYDEYMDEIIEEKFD